MRPMFVLPLFAWPVLVGWRGGVGRWRVPALLTGALCLIIPGALLARTPAPAVPLQRYVPPLVRYLDEQSDRYGLRYGLAGYWQARLITLLSQTGLRAYQVLDGLRPFYWVDNVQWYNESVEDRTKRPRFNFVVLNDPTWKIQRDAVVRIFGHPTQELYFGNVPVLVYGPDRSVALDFNPAGAVRLP